MKKYRFLLTIILPLFFCLPAKPMSAENETERLEMYILMKPNQISLLEGDTAGPCSVLASLLDHANTSPLATLTAEPTGLGPFIYTWTSFGGAETGFDKEKTLKVWLEDEYCVVSKDATGCIAVDCYVFNPDSFYCRVSIQMEPFSDHALLTLLKYTNAQIVNTQWNTGENTPEITIYQPGIYEVTAVNETGCSSTDQIELGPCNKLNVYVEMTDSLDGIAAMVYLYLMGTTPPLLLDSTLTDPTTGIARFENIPIGEYTVSASLLPASPWYQQYELVNFAENAAAWQQAQTVSVPLFCQDSYYAIPFLSVWLQKKPGLLDNALVFPNPVSDILTLDLFDQAYFFRLTDINGQVLRQEDVPAQSGAFGIPMQAYGNGIYFLQIRIGNQWQVFRIVKF